MFRKDILPLSIILICMQPALSLTIPAQAQNLVVLPTPPFIEQSHQELTAVTAKAPQQQSNINPMAASNPGQTTNNKANNENPTNRQLDKKTTIAKKATQAHRPLKKITINNFNKPNSSAKNGTSTYSSQSKLKKNHNHNDKKILATNASPASTTQVVSSQDQASKSESSQQNDVAVTASTTTTAINTTEALTSQKQAAQPPTMKHSIIRIHDCLLLATIHLGNWNVECMRTGSTDKSSWDKSTWKVATMTKNVVPKNIWPVCSWLNGFGYEQLITTPNLGLDRRLGDISRRKNIFIYYHGYEVSGGMTIISRLGRYCPDFGKNVHQVKKESPDWLEYINF